MGPSVKFVLTIIDAKQYFLSGIARITHLPPPPLSGNLYLFFGRQKRRFACMTEKIPQFFWLGNASIMVETNFTLGPM